MQNLHYCVIDLRNSEKPVSFPHFETSRTMSSPCTDKPEASAEAPCAPVERPPRRGVFLLVAVGLVSLGFFAWTKRPNVHVSDSLLTKTPKFLVNVARRAQAPVPIYATGELRRGADPNRGEVELQLDTNEGSIVRVGDSAEVRIRALDGRAFQGRVITAMERPDGGARPVAVTIELDLKDAPEVKPGRVDFIFTPVGGAPILVPITAIVWRDGEFNLAMVDTESRLRWRKVDAGREYGSQIEITSGLAVEEWYLPRPDRDLPEGAKIDVSEKR